MLRCLAAVLASLQTFLGFSERAEKHRFTAASYSSVCRHLELLNAFYPQENKEVENILSKIKTEMDSLSKSAPDIPQRIKRMFVKY